MRYTVLVDGQLGGYGVVFPDLPGCTAMGKTTDEALANAAEALSDWVRAKEAAGSPIPEPQPLEALRRTPRVAEAINEGAALASVVLVRDIGRPVKANLSLDAGVLASIDTAASRLGLTRSALVERLAREGLPHLVV